MGTMQNPSILSWRLECHTGNYMIDSFPLAASVRTLDQASLLLPQGAYTTFRSYSHNRCLRFNEHIQRLSDSARIANVQVVLVPDRLRPAIREIVQQSIFPEARIRITLDLEAAPGDLYVTLEELHVPPETSYLEGVLTKTQIMHREKPKAKLTGFIATASSFRENLAPGVNEILMVTADGHILEGMSSNFFACIEGNFYTAEEGVLPGITRQIVLDLINQAHLPIVHEAIRLEDLEKVEECLITSASRAVLPVRQIDEQVIGLGSPGQITRKLILRFSEWIKYETEEI